MSNAVSSTISTYAERLLHGLALSIAEKGYVNTTIADIVRHAKVSRRTFYECFVDKRACLLYSYQYTSLATFEHVSAAIAHAWQQSDQFAIHVHHGVITFIEAVKTRPRYMYVLMSEILLIDADGLTLRRNIMNHFSELLQQVVQHAMPERIISPLLTTALVGAMNEMVLWAVEQNTPQAFEALVEPMQQMIVSVAALATRRL